MQNDTFAARLKATRMRLGIGVQELADRAGVTRQTINYYEHGLRYPDIIILCRIADALGADCNYLCGYESKFDAALHTKSIDNKIDDLITELRAFKSSLDNQSHQ